MSDETTRSLTTWDPFEDFGLLRGLSPFRRSELARLAPERLAFGPGGQAVPAVDISEDDDHFVVTAEIPGADKDDVTVEAHEQLLTIRGEKRCEREETKEQARYVERSYGSFSRSFRLPANADTGAIKAHFRDGVLRIEVPKAPESKPKSIVIHA